MKWIIEGKLYDTETAERLYSQEQRTQDGLHQCELYRTTKGSYFLVHKWRENVECIALSGREAKAWAEARMTVEQYVGAFGQPETA